MSGTFNGFTTGAPVLISFRNVDTRGADYAQFLDTPRPGHADFTASVKYMGFADYRVSGHFSGRLTAGLVDAGAVARKIISPVTVTARICEIGGSNTWEDALENSIAARDSLGGIIECTATDIPAGWGEPFFDSAESIISHIVFAIPGIKGIEFGAGFAAARMPGSQHNDTFVSIGGTTETNHAGGINGGITNGNNIVFRVAVKPTASIKQPQQTANMRTGETVTLEIPGRHDVCFALRVPPVLEAAACIALADMKLQTTARNITGR
jgi:chorismate synthase